MTYKELLALVITLQRDEAALATTAALARAFDAKAKALIVSVNVGSAYETQAQPLSAVLEDIAQGPRSRANLEREAIEAWVQRAPDVFETHQLSIEEAAGRDQVAAHARVCDLAVAIRPHERDPARQELIEDVLFKSGRPVLLVPEAWRRERWDTVVIGWNAKPEAVRAISAGLPFLKAAKRVIVTTVDATPSGAGHSDKPGFEIAAHLARHGAPVEVRNVDGLGRTHGRALLDEAMAVDADMLLLGAYGHSRAREYVFGGVTRELMFGSPVPLFMAH